VFVLVFVLQPMLSWMSQRMSTASKDGVCTNTMESTQKPQIIVDIISDPN